MDKAPGTIITFYSYKGGTGRSMALANSAWILAANGFRVLTIDWDLEAPGLHRYFRPFLIDAELSSSPGLINFFWDYASQVMTPHENRNKENDWWEKASRLDRYTVRLDWEFEGEGCLDFVGAGQQDTQYAELVNSFNWTDFYQRLDGELLLERLREMLRADYDYVLIDSRTGVSDTSGICTVSMPDRLVALFTFNRQSIDGVAAVLESIVPQREDEPLLMFPVVTRVELGEKDRLEAARGRVRRLFAPYTRNGSSDLQDYWSDMEIIYQPYYAYEEILAPFGDPTGSNRSPTALLAAMERLTGKISGQPDIAMPMVADRQRRDILGQFAGTERAEQGDDTEAKTEERRLRAEKYMERDLGDPVRHYTEKSRISRAQSRLSFVAVIAAQLLIPLLMVASPSMWAAPGVNYGILPIMAFAVCGSIILLRVLEETARTNIKRLRYSAVTLLSLLSEGGLLVWIALFSDRPTSQFISDFIVSPRAAVAIAMTAIAAQTYSLIKRPADLTVQYKRIVDELKREQRHYVHALEAYSAHDVAWKVFVKKLESLLMTIPGAAREEGDTVAVEGEN